MRQKNLVVSVNKGLHLSFLEQIRAADPYIILVLFKKVTEHLRVYNSALVTLISYELLCRYPYLHVGFEHLMFRFLISE